MSAIVANMESPALNLNLLIYPVHIAFWSAFGLTRMLTRNKARQADQPAAGATIAEREQTAPFSRAILALHIVAFATMYFGVGNAVFGHRMPSWFHGQLIAGIACIIAGAVLACWAVAFFHSWRFRAKLDQGHELATEGPFKLVRHPIYAGLNLLALGTSIWIPTPTVWFGFVLMVIGSDLRARSEEVLLIRAFGSTYTEYRAYTPRFIPWLY